MFTTLIWFSTRLRGYMVTAVTVTVLCNLVIDIFALASIPVYR